MEQFTYKDGTEAKSGDICFYSEMPYSTYADSIVRLLNHGGKLCSTTVICNNGTEYVETSDTPTPVFGTFSEPFILDSYTKIGNVDEHPERMTLAYANEHHPFDPAKF